MRTLRKLVDGTFSDRYRFKRLLQTDPDVARLYKRQADAINSVPAVKDIAIYEDDELCAYVPSKGVTADATAPIIRLSKGQAEWPRRVTFPEQIRQLYEEGRAVWSVNLTVMPTSGILKSGRKPSDKEFKIRMKRSDAPVIATKSRTMMWAYEPVKKDKIRHIDQNLETFFYLVDFSNKAEDEEAWDIWTAGVSPNLMSEFNACFYDREVAHLYAQSLKEEAKRIESMHFKN